MLHSIRNREGRTPKRLNMALDKRKRKKVNAMVQEGRKIQSKIRENRIESNRDEEYSDCIAMGEHIQKCKEKLGIGEDGFENRLETFDVSKIICHDLPKKVGGKWKQVRNTKKQEDIKKDLNYLKNGRKQIFQFTEELEAQRIKAVEGGKTATSLELAALKGDFC
jgi:hypothetical protein